MQRLYGSQSLRGLTRSFTPCLDQSRSFSFFLIREKHAIILAIILHTQHAPSLPGIILRTDVSTDLTICSFLSLDSEARSEIDLKNKAYIRRRKELSYFKYDAIIKFERSPFMSRFDLSPLSRHQIRRKTRP